MSKAWVLMALLVVLFNGSSSCAQDCPRTSPDGSLVASSSYKLDGRLVFHDDLRQWFELKLNDPICGEKSVQLVAQDKGWAALQVLRGCVVKSSGSLNTSGTGYFSLKMYQDVIRIRPTRDCERMPRFPDYSKARPGASIRTYHVAMRLHYQTDGPLEASVVSGVRRLAPWQVYASYSLTGDFSYYAFCRKGFVAEHPQGTLEGKPWVLDTYVAFDPESVPKGVDPVLLDYDCRRLRRGE